MGFLVFGVEKVEAQPIFLRNSLLPFDHFCLEQNLLQNTQLNPFRVFKARGVPFFYYSPLFRHIRYTKKLLKNLLEEISVIKISNSSWINITICEVLCTKSPMKQKCYENDLPGIFPEIIHVNWSQMRLNEPRVNHCFALAQKLPSPSNLFSSEK